MLPWEIVREGGDMVGIRGYGARDRVLARQWEGDTLVLRPGLFVKNLSS